MRKLYCIVSIVLLLGLAGCMGESAEQMMKTAQFEELQNNREHARQLYERIVRDHPKSAEATLAAERLRALDAPPEEAPAP